MSLTPEQERQVQSIVQSVPTALRAAVWHELANLLHHKDAGGVTAQDSGGHGGTNPPPPKPI